MLPTTIVYFFFVAQILGGHVGVPLILCTAALSKHVQKHPYLLNFLANWILYATSFCLLLYAGHQFDTEKPLTLCILQLSMVYGAAISTALSGLVLVFNIWLTIKRLGKHVDQNDLDINDQQRTDTRQSNWTTAMLLSIPYLAFVVVVILFVLAVGHTPSLVDRTQDSLYCSFRSDLRSATPYILMMIILSIFTLEILVILKLVQFQKKSPKIQVKNDASVHLFARIGIFTLFSVLSLIAAIGFWFKSDKVFAYPHVIQALLPAVACLVFGTQKDMLTAWHIIPLWNRLFGRKSTISSPSRPTALQIPPPYLGLFTNDTKEATRTPARPCEASPVAEGGQTIVPSSSPKEATIPSFSSSEIHISEARI